MTEKADLIQNASTDGLKKTPDILKSSKQIINSLAWFLYDIVPILYIIVLLSLYFLFFL